jgi:hypothetical protein
MIVVAHIMYPQTVEFAGDRQQWVWSETVEHNLRFILATG